MLAGNITMLLKQEYRDQGYSLSESEDFLYLHFEGKVVAVFNARAGNLKRVYEYIEGQKDLFADIETAMNTVSARL